MQTRVAEVAEGIFQLSTHLEDIDFSVNQILVTGDEPLLFHTGMRGLFPLVSEAVARVVPIDALRWISFGHVEADECGALNSWLGVAPHATPVQGQIGCMVSVGDLADRAPHPLGDGETLNIGGHVLRWIDTPHLPHAWEAGVLYDETTRTLLCGDLFSRMGAFGPTSSDDPVGPARAAEDEMPSMSLHPRSSDLLRALAELEVTTLAPMHAPAFVGDCRQALLDLAADVDRRIAG